MTIVNASFATEGLVIAPGSNQFSFDGIDDDGFNAVGNYSWITTGGDDVQAFGSDITGTGDPPDSGHATQINIDLSNNGPNDVTITGITRPLPGFPPGFIATDARLAVITDSSTAFFNEVMSLNDTVTGSAFADTIKAGGGADTLNLGSGADFGFGDNGADTLNGGNGTDVLNGGAGGDILFGGAGADTINTGAANDNILDRIRFSATTHFGDTVTNFDANGIVDRVEFGGALNTALDDRILNDNFQFVSGNGAAGAVAANLNAAVEALRLTGANGEGVTTANLGNAGAVAGAFNAEFIVTAAGGQDALLVVNDTNNNSFSAWRYVESGAGAEIQAGELTRIGTFAANATVGVASFDFF